MTPSIEFLEQHAALTRGWGVSDLSDRTRLELRGSDRASFLHAFCTNDIQRLRPGEGCEAFVTSVQGKTLGHVFVFCEPDCLLLDTAPGQAAELVAHFAKYVISEDVELIDRSADTSCLLVAGAEAQSKLQLLAARELSETMFTATEVGIGGTPVAIRRVPYAGASSYFVQIIRAETAGVIETLLQAGAVRCSGDAAETVRVECGFPLFGREITADNLPQEIGRDSQAISFKKGCYLGQETVARIDALGHVNRLLASVRFASDPLPAVGDVLLADEKEVGRVTSSVWSPALGRPLALTFLRRAQARPGTLLSSASGPCEVIAPPLPAVS